MNIITKVYKIDTIIEVVYADEWLMKEQVIKLIQKGEEFRTLNEEGPLVVVVNNFLKTENNKEANDNLDNLPIEDFKNLPVSIRFKLLKKMSSK